MAAIRKQIKVGSGPQALRDSGTFSTKRAADQWAARRRAELLAQLNGTEGRHKTLQDAMRKFALEECDKRGGGPWEQKRLAAFERHLHLPLMTRLSDITPEQLNRWVEWRKTQVASSSARRELSLMGSVFTAARKDWRWIKESPVRDAVWPEAPPGRIRTLTRTEIKGMLRELGYRRRRPQSISESVANLFLLALRTGMRSGELTTLTWAQVHGAYLHLPKTKTDTPRDVPLSKKARRILQRMQGWDEESVFAVAPQSRDALWRAARARAKLSGFTFHDVRHTAATWVARDVDKPGKISFPQFIKMFGWSNDTQALKYVNPNAAELADLL